MANLEIILTLLSVAFPLFFIPVFIAMRKADAKVRNMLYVVQTCTHLIIILLLVFTGMPLLPFGVSFWLNFQVSTLTLGIIGAIAASNFLVLLYNYGHGYSRSAWYDTFLCILLSGLIGAVLSADIVTSYVFMDIVLFSAGYLIYSLHALPQVPGRSPRRKKVLYGEAIKAAYKYIFMNLFGSFFILFSVVLYSSPGSSATLMAAGFLIGLLIKAGAVPFHFWVPTVYSEAPIPVTALLAGSANAVVLFTLYKFLPILSAGAFLQSIGLLTAVTGAVLSIGQRNIRKTFSYFSVAETGFALYALGLGTPAALTGFLFLIITQIFSKTVLFEFAGLVTEHDSVLIKHYGLALFALLIGGFSIIGIPPTGGFIGKYMMLSAAVHLSGIVPAALLLFSGFLMCFSLLRVYKHLSVFEGKLKPHYTILDSLFFMSAMIVVIGIIPFLGGKVI